MGIMGVITTLPQRPCNAKQASISVHSILICWLLEYSVMLV
jgi:hypothetical protein